MENTHNLIIPKTNLIGTGAIKDLPNELMDWKLSKALIVTDMNMVILGYVEMIEKILKSLFITYDIFEGVKHPNPTTDFVEDGLSYFPKGVENLVERDYKLIISIGGGTNHDCAKSIATVAANGGSIIDYEGWNKITKPAIPTICINTTGGSGAEMSMFVVITDLSRKSKIIAGSPMITPYITVNDPLFMPTMPKEITASTGIDVITHAIESYVATESSPITDSLCLNALRTAFQYLPRAFDNGNDLEAREKMMYASVMAGIVLCNAGLGYVHAMSHQLGGYYNQNHGDYDAILLPYVFEFNADFIPEERVFKIAEAIGIEAGSKSEAIDKIMTSIQKLSSDIGIKSSLKEMGVEESNFEYFTQNALKDMCALTNPRKGTAEDIIKLYKSAL